MDCYYKRFTPVLTETHTQENLEFYKVNRDHSFIAFKDPNKRSKGFARDLFVDYMRWNYYKGSIAWLNPQKIGLGQFPQTDRALFGDLVKDYKDQICTTYKSMRVHLENLCKLSK